MARKDAGPMDMPAAGMAGARWDMRAAGMAAATALASRLGVTVAPAVVAATRRPHATSTATADDLKLPLIPESLRADADPWAAKILYGASWRPSRPVRIRRDWRRGHRSSCFYRRLALLITRWALARGSCGRP